MGNFLEELKKHDNELIDIARTYMDLQLTCMLLHYAGLMKLEAGYEERGRIIIDTVQGMRKNFEEMQSTYEASLGKESIQKTFEKIKYYQTLYSIVTDDILAVNVDFFPLPPRPPGAEYACNEVACMKKLNALATDYFKELWTDAA